MEELTKKRATISAEFDRSEEMMRRQIAENSGREGFDATLFDVPMQNLQEAREQALASVDQQITKYSVSS